MGLNWVTNDPIAAAELKAADATLEAARLAARDLCLADKVNALRAAKHAHAAAYRKVIRAEGYQTVWKAAP